MNIYIYICVCGYMDIILHGRVENVEPVANLKNVGKAELKSLRRFDTLEN